MVPKKVRLTATEVREVLKVGRPLRAPTVSAKVISSAVGKAAMVASTKVSKKATERNTMRRRGYRALPHPMPPYHMVFFLQRRDFDSADVALICSKLS